MKFEIFFPVFLILALVLIGANSAYDSYLRYELKNKRIDCVIKTGKQELCYENY